MDLIEWFEDNDLEYWSSGKNVSVGWVNIQCVFCDDLSNHLGIRLSDYRVHCWKCGGNTMANVIMAVTSCNYGEARRVLKSLAVGVDLPKIEKTLSVISKVRLPQEFTKKLPRLHRQYLRSRGFLPKKILRKYKLMACHTIGKYKFRLVIPIIMNRKVVSFTTRAVVDDMTPKYLHAKQSESIIDPAHAIYNYDNLEKNHDAFLVEGPLDVWKLGNGAVSIFGVEHTIEQLKHLSRKRIRNLYVLFDADAAGTKSAKKLAPIMAPICRSVEILTLENRSDPGELSTQEVTEIKTALGFNI